MALRTTFISPDHSFIRTLPQQRKERGVQRGYRPLRSKFAANVWLDRCFEAKRDIETVPSYELRFLSDRALVPVARRAASKYACALSAFDGEALDEIQMAVGEALANAVEHGHRDGSYISVRCESRGDAFQVTVRDGGTGFEPREPVAVGSCPDRGYGIGIMRHAMDRVEFLGGGTTVKMLKRFITTRANPQGASA